MGEFRLATSATDQRMNLLRFYRPAAPSTPRCAHGFVVTELGCTTVLTSEGRENTKAVWCAPRTEHCEGKEASDWGQKGRAVCATDQRIILVRFHPPPRPDPRGAVPQCSTLDLENTLSTGHASTTFTRSALLAPSAVEKGGVGFE